MGFARTFRNEVGSFVDSLDEIFFIFKLGELGADKTKNSRFVLG